MTTLRASISPKTRREVLAKTGGRCHMCGDDLGTSWQVDHVLPHKSGGLDSVDNFMPICGRREQPRENAFRPDLASNAADVGLSNDRLPVFVLAMTAG